ncbi:MAG: hypothetical protein ACM3KE_13025 [Hyphomicrobiales bacterium]
MPSAVDMKKLNLNIQSARKAVEELKRLGEDFPAVARNAERMLASLKMIEINVSDVMDLGGRHFKDALGGRKRRLT